MFDFSNYSKDSKFFGETNKKVIVIEFVGLKSKMYTIKKIDGKECNTAKGLGIATVFDKFKNLFFDEKIIRHKMKRIQSKKHFLNSEVIRAVFKLFIFLK